MSTTGWGVLSGAPRNGKTGRQPSPFPPQVCSRHAAGALVRAVGALSGSASPGWPRLRRSKRRRAYRCCDMALSALPVSLRSPQGCRRDYREPRNRFMRALRKLSMAHIPPFPAHGRSLKGTPILSHFTNHCKGVRRIEPDPVWEEDQDPADRTG